MTTTTITPATQTVDEQKFINKLYDENLSTQKNTLQDNYTQNTGALDAEKQSVQQQTDDNIARTYVEADKAYQASVQQPNAPMLSGGANVQATLSRDNQARQDVTTLNNAQSEADAEIERERALLASEYEAAIKQAQADNDMQRAQQLYDAAKKEEERLTEYKKTAGNLLAGKGDYSLLADLYGLTEAQVKTLGGDVSKLTPVASSTTGSTPESTGAAADYTTPDALKDDEEYLRRIYDASLESQRQELKTEYDRDASDIQAEREEAQRKTDKDLTDAYVKAAQKAKNYNEVQRAYGMGSGTLGQAQLAQDLQLQKDLTALRGVQMGTDADLKRKESDRLAKYLAAIADAETGSNKKFAEEFIKAGQDEEEKQIALQLEAGNLLAGKNDYSILGALYGLTPDQIDRLQGTGAYAHHHSGGGGDDGSSGGSKKTGTKIQYGTMSYTPKSTPTSSSGSSKSNNPSYTSTGNNSWVKK